MKAQKHQRVRDLEDCTDKVGPATLSPVLSGSKMKVGKRRDVVISGRGMHIIVSCLQLSVFNKSVEEHAR